MKAMIFAAGLGTRLKPLTDTMPKALVPVSGKPLIQHVSEKLAAAGFTDIVVNVHHFADMIEFWCHAAQLQSDAMTFTLSDERAGLLETGGGVRHAASSLKDAPEGRFLIHNVDILSNVDLPAFWKAGEGSDATLLVSERETQRYLIFDKDMRLVGWTNVKTGEVKSPFPAVLEAFNPDYVTSVNTPVMQMSSFAYVPSEHQYTLLAFAGIHQMSTSLLPIMDDYPEKFSIIDFYLQHCHEYVIRGYVQPNLKLMDVGKLDTLDKAVDFLASINEKP